MDVVAFEIVVLAVVLLNPKAGDQEYEVPPLALSVALEPLQIVALFTAGTKFETVTVCVAEVVQPPADVAIRPIV